jgi:hypothetical protein
MGVPANAAYQAALLAMFRDEDPTRLIKMGASGNEYKPEVESVASWTKAVTPDRVRNLMRRWFGDWGQMSDTDAERLAEGILHLQRQYGLIETSPNEDA